MKELSKKDRLQRLKKEKSIVLGFGLFVLIILLTMSVGYAYESNQLNIYGTAYISGYVLEEGELPSVPIKEGDNYVGGGDPPGGGTINEEYWEGNTYNLTFGVPGTIGSLTTYTYTVKVQNNTSLPWTDGTVSSEITNTGGGWLGKALQSFSPSLSSTIVNPGEILTLTFTVKYRTNLDCSAAATATAIFNFNGEERKLVFNINFAMQ